MHTRAAVALLAVAVRPALGLAAARDATPATTSWLPTASCSALASSILDAMPLPASTLQSIEWDAFTRNEPCPTLPASISSAFAAYDDAVSSWYAAYDDALYSIATACSGFSAYSEFAAAGPASFFLADCPAGNAAPTVSDATTTTPPVGTVAPAAAAASTTTSTATSQTSAAVAISLNAAPQEKALAGVVAAVAGVVAAVAVL